MHDPKFDEPRHNDTELFRVSSQSLHFPSPLQWSDEKGDGRPEGGLQQTDGESAHGRHEESDNPGAELLLPQHLQHTLHPRHRLPEQVRTVPSDRRNRDHTEQGGRCVEQLKVKHETSHFVFHSGQSVQLRPVEATSRLGLLRVQLW